MTTHYVPRHRGVSLPMARLSLEVQLRVLDVDQQSVSSVLTVWEASPQRDVYADTVLELAKLGQPPAALATTATAIIDASAAMAQDPRKVAELYAHAVAVFGPDARLAPTLSFITRTIAAAGG